MTDMTQPDSEEAVMARARALGLAETVAEAYAARAGGPPPGMHVSQWMRAQVVREFAAHEAAAAPALPAHPQPAQDRALRAGAAPSSSKVLSVRLGREEYAALLDRAQRVGGQPSALARGYIRAALHGGRRAEWTAALDRLDAVIVEMRDLAT